MGVVAGSSGADKAGARHEPSTDPRPIAEPTKRRARWWAVAAGFIAGIVVGVIVAGLLAGGNSDFAARSGDGGPSAQAPNPGSSIPVLTDARVNAACLAVINSAQDVYLVLTDVGPAAEEVDLQRLDDIVRRLQPIETRLGQDLGNCQVTTAGSEPTDAPSEAQPTSNPPQPTPTATR